MGEAITLRGSAQHTFIDSQAARFVPDTLPARRVWSAQTASARAALESGRTFFSRRRWCADRWRRAGAPGSSAPAGSAPAPSAGASTAAAGASAAAGCASSSPYLLAAPRLAAEPHPSSPPHVERALAAHHECGMRSAREPLSQHPGRRCAHVIDYHVDKVRLTEVQAHGGEDAAKHTEVNMRQQHPSDTTFCKGRATLGIQSSYSGMSSDAHRW